MDIAPDLPRPSGRMHQPWRGIVAVVELVLAVALAFAAAWSWRHGVVTITFPPFQQGQAPLEVTRYFGNWIAGGIALAVVAGFALIDAVRQAILATRSRGQDGSAQAD